MALDVEGTQGTARFSITDDGQYYVAATVGGERIRLTDDFFITVLDDRAPEISFARPGRDWSASRIEEVTTRVSAEDDFHVDTLDLYSAKQRAAYVKEAAAEIGVIEAGEVVVYQ